ncbi:hypothetical protein CC86DRAFT_404817 [Ophiobolus disseminans]|uniref:Uncharacterized protein n=1 Tax=Ophiobolus disseminans TaxID=1469910 RepID=A0A6A7A4U6_9PLEO|nr:hypothetical protein CC86DRAFT_404817 [Ophiobolus disseminans]
MVSSTSYRMVMNDQMSLDISDSVNAKSRIQKELAQGVASQLVVKNKQGEKPIKAMEFSGTSFAAPDEPPTKSTIDSPGIHTLLVKLGFWNALRNNHKFLATKALTPSITTTQRDYWLEVLAHVFPDLSSSERSARCIALMAIEDTASRQAWNDKWMSFKHVKKIYGSDAAIDKGHWVLILLNVSNGYGKFMPKVAKTIAIAPAKTQKNQDEDMHISVLQQPLPTDESLTTNIFANITDSTGTTPLTRRTPKSDTRRPLALSRRSKDVPNSELEFPATLSAVAEFAFDSSKLDGTVFAKPALTELSSIEDTTGCGFQTGLGIQDAVVKEELAGCIEKDTTEPCTIERQAIDNSLTLVDTRTDAQGENLVHQIHQLSGTEPDSEDSHHDSDTSSNNTRATSPDIVPNAEIGEFVTFEIVRGEVRETYHCISIADEPDCEHGEIHAREKLPVKTTIKDHHIDGTVPPPFGALRTLPLDLDEQYQDKGEVREVTEHSILISDAPTVNSLNHSGAPKLKLHLAPPEDLQAWVNNLLDDAFDITRAPHLPPLILDDIPFHCEFDPGTFFGAIDEIFDQTGGIDEDPEFPSSTVGVECELASPQPDPVIHAQDVLDKAVDILDQHINTDKAANGQVSDIF